MIRLLILGAMASLLLITATSVSADPSGTCPYAYCEYVAPRPPIPTGPPYYPSPWSTPSPTPRAKHKHGVIIVNTAPLPPPTATRGPVHFPLYQPYSYECDCYTGQP